MFVLFSGIICPIFILGAAHLFADKPPSEIIEEGRVAIAEARNEEANLYSPNELKKAETLWMEAMAEWKENNGKNPVRRNFKKTNVIARKTIEIASIAKSNAINKKLALHKEIEVGLADLRANSSFIEQITNKLPLNHGIRKKLTPLKLKIDEIESAYRRNDLISAQKNLLETQKTLLSLKEQTTNLLTDYFSNYSEWIKLDEEMKHWSKKNSSVSLVVDKLARRCIVYKQGKIYKEFDVELGVNWLGDKKQSGDKATPEGLYSITAKKSGNKTIYYKTLSINYPNHDDRKRFEQEKARGNIPKNATIGGSIAIHGGGGKGIDWTEGCVALVNNDMDVLYSLCVVGTPVAIVGSLKPIESIIE